MTIIKLNATNSTNTYLKQLVAQQLVEHFTVVITENQTEGKGQMGSKWETEVGKNLTFSVLVKDVLTTLQDIFNLNVLVSVSVLEALNILKIPNLSIKWANDILSDKKKIAGLLIENVVKSNQEIHSIIGIGLNVNQEKFDNLPQASSLKNIMHQNFDKEEVLQLILNQLNLNLNQYKNFGAAFFWNKYHENLYKINSPMAFENQQQQKFMGIIKQILPNGLLQVMLEDDSVETFDLKEIKMLY